MAKPETPPIRGKIFAWTLFDFANTAFSVVIVTVVYQVYFIDRVSGGMHTLWGIAVSISMICAAALSPFLGAAADYSNLRKRFLLAYTLVCVVCTAALFFVKEGMILSGMLFFIFANIGFEGGLVFYDSFLPRLTAKSSYGRVSGYGFAMGYLGALAVLLIVKLIIPEPSDPAYFYSIRFSFVVAAGFFLIFSLPLFIAVEEPPRAGKEIGHYIGRGFQQAKKTIREIFITKEYPDIRRYLIAFFLYNDGIMTVIVFASTFAKDVVRMGLDDIILFFIIVQTSAFFGSVVFGFITDKIGPKKTISATLIIWIAISVGAYFVDTLIQFYAVALAAGMAIGSSQSASRSLMALLAPKDREAEFFGFYDGLCGKASAVIGPVVYGLVSDITDVRVATLSISLFFISGLVILQKVREPERRTSPEKSA